MNKLVFYGETFSGRYGVDIDGYIYFCSPLDAIKSYCDDEIHGCDMDSFDWYLCEDETKTLIYKGANV